MAARAMEWNVGDGVSAGGGRLRAGSWRPWGRVGSQGWKWLRSGRGGGVGFAVLDFGNLGLAGVEFEF